MWQEDHSLPALGYKTPTSWTCLLIFCSCSLSLAALAFVCLCNIPSSLLPQDFCTCQLDAKDALPWFFHVCLFVMTVAYEMSPPSASPDKLFWCGSLPHLNKLSLLEMILLSNIFPGGLSSLPLECDQQENGDLICLIFYSTFVSSCDYLQYIILWENWSSPWCEILDVQFWV